MDYKRLEKLVENNTEEIKKLEKNSELSEEARKERIKVIEEKNKKLTLAINKLKAREVEIEKDETLTEEQKKNYLEREYKVLTSPKNYNFWSKLNSFIYNNKKPSLKQFSDLAWKNKQRRVNSRYKSIFKYGLKNTVIFIGISALALSAGSIPLAIGAYAFAISSIGKAIVTKINKQRYGKPLLIRDINESNISDLVYENNELKPVQKGKREEVVNKASMDKDKDNVLLNSISHEIKKIDIDKASVNELEQIIIVATKVSDKLSPEIKEKYDRIRESYTARLKASDTKSEAHKEPEIDKKEEIKKEPKKPNIDDYANLDVFNVDKVESKNKDMTFNEAISIVRGGARSRDEWEMAMTNLARMLGNGKKKNSEDIAKVLNDFNKTEKLLSEYGRKIKEGTATGEDKLIHQALLYHLGKYDVIDKFSFESLEDDINDYIADEAERFDRDYHPENYDEEGNYKKGRK